MWGYPMNAITGTERIDLNEEKNNLTAVSDVEASIRDFVHVMLPICAKH
jgi:hypothetical protein